MFGKVEEQHLAFAEIIVAEADGRLLGFMSLAEGGYIDFAYIRAEARGAGLFRELFKRILDRARAKALPLLWVHASLTAEPTFAALGFLAREREQMKVGGEVLDRFEMEVSLESGGGATTLVTGSATVLRRSRPPARQRTTR